MKATTIAVHWHDDNHPIYSLDFQPSQASGTNRPSIARRLATAGGDNNIRIWRVQYPKADEDISIEYLSTLRKHTQAVNVVRFDPSGRMLASGGDDGFLVVWELADKIVAEFGHQEDEVQESWTPRHVYNTSSEIYDLAWSPDSSRIVTGSMDNSAKVYSVQNGSVCEMAHHTHYVQGVSWDPLDEFVATQSADRSMGVYSLSSGTPALLSRMSRADLPAAKLSKTPGSGDRTKKSSALYHSETLQSFFRRLAFSPDGSLLLTPSGVFRNLEDNKNDKPDATAGNVAEGAEKNDKSDKPDDAALNTVYIYTRGGLSRAPVCHLPGLAKPAIAIAFSPVRYALGTANAVFSLPYKMVFAVATQDSVVVYDTEQLQPLGMVSNLHYLTITDLCWERDGSSILVSSAEGFCSAITFEPGTFGSVYVDGLAKDDDSTDGGGLKAGISAEPRAQVPAPAQVPAQVPAPAPSQVQDKGEIVAEAIGLTEPPAAVGSLSNPVEIPETSETSNKLQDSSQTTKNEEVYHGERASISGGSKSSDNGLVTQSLLDQFMAKPIVAATPTAATPTAATPTAATPHGSGEKRQAEGSGEPKKKRITPTLVQRE